LKDHEKITRHFYLNLLPLYGGFNEYLRGKPFILYTDHKPLEKMGHIHTKTMNRLQLALLEHDFVFQYKKRAMMPADYLSRLPSTKQDHLAEITTELQKADPDLQKMNHF
jgi:hypothetical protein